MHAKSRNLWIAAGVAVAVIALALLMLPADDEDPGTRSAGAADKGAGEEQGSGMPEGHPPVSTEPASDGPPASGDVASVDPDAHFTHFRVGPRNVKTIFPDGDIMWVGTAAGVIRYDTSNDEYRLLDTRTGLLANGVFHLGKINGRLSVGTYGGGLSILNEAEDDWRIYNIPDGLGDGFIYDALQLENGDVWIATWSGANRVRGGDLDDRDSWDLYTVANTDGALPNDWVYALHAGTDGEVWFATEGGLARFKDEAWQNWKHEDGLGADYDLVRDQIEFDMDPGQYSQHHARQKVEMGLETISVAYNPNYIVALEVDNDGTVWCGTWGGGLSSFDGEKWRNYTVADGLPGNHVFMLHVDPAGELWIGTNNGLARLKDDEFTRFTTEDGLFSNRIFSMATADDGSKWVGSFGGVARIAKLD
jgi:ligand-binding sensor domain-containing protein